MISYVVFSARSSLQYRANFVGFLILAVITYAFRLAFMSELVDVGGGELGGWDREKVLTLYYVGLVVTLLSWSVASSVDEFYRHAIKGTLEPHLMRPVGLSALIFFRWVAGPNVLVLVVVLPIAIIDQRRMLFAAGALELLVATTAVILAVIAIVSAMLLAYSLSLILQRHVPVDYIFSELFRLVQAPPTVFTGAWAALVVVGLPLIVGVWAPVAALEGSFGPFYALIAIALITALCAMQTTRASLRAFDGLGG